MEATPGPPRLSPASALHEATKTIINNLGKAIKTAVNPPPGFLSFFGLIPNSSTGSKKGKIIKDSAGEPKDFSFLVWGQDLCDPAGLPVRGPGGLGGESLVA